MVPDCNPISTKAAPRLSGADTEFPSDAALWADLEKRAQQRGLSIADVCRSAGVARSTLMRWKQGATSPRVRVYRRVLSVLEVSERKKKAPRRRRSPPAGAAI